MEKIKIKTVSQHALADTITPVSIFLKIRDKFPNSVLLESSDYHGNKNSYSFIGLQPVAGFIADRGTIQISYPGQSKKTFQVGDQVSVPSVFYDFINSFVLESKDLPVNIAGFFGYSTYDSVTYFEDIKFHSPANRSDQIPEFRYHLYKYVIAINHFQNNLTLFENLFEEEQSNIHKVLEILQNLNFAVYPFKANDDISSNKTDEEYRNMVTKGKEHCFRGDVFQIVLSRQYKQTFTGDEFNVYRALRSINPSPYLFYFDYGSYKIFGSSPEAQIEISGNKATIYPIAGTFRRTGDDEKDRLLAEELSNDKKENAEHVMLVDLARNDLSRNTKEVVVESFKEVQFYSHVIHLVSKVTGKLSPGYNPVKVLADSFPAGTLSGAPKYKAMELIDKYENKSRGYYGGCIGFIGFNGDVNHAIMIRSFLSKDNTLFFQAGAGIVSESIEENELQEVNNKLAALRKAIEIAQQIN